MPSQDDTLEKRVERIERLLARAIEVGNQTPVGRKILAMLGLQ